MKFKTKLIITFLTILVLPLILSGIAFVGIGVTIVHNSDLRYGIETSDYRTISDSLASFSEMTEELYRALEETALDRPAMLEDEEYLSRINEDASRLSSYILVRKGERIYYSGNETATQKIFGRLPDYGMTNRDANTGFYYNDMQKLVKQMDFQFSDGENGSLFIITRVNSVISKSLLIYMFISIIVVLMVTSIILTQWIYKGVFAPINRLNVAMQNIAEGNFEYILASADTNEIGEIGRAHV